MKVLKKQTNSKDCFICGIENKLGVNASFYEMEDGKLYSLFKFKPEHQSFPQRTHGGIISALLDELIGRTIWIKDDTIWGVTIDLNIKYRKPVPYDVPLKAIGDLLGGRDHTTIMHARDKIGAQIKTNPHIRTLVNDIKSLLLKY